MLESITMFGSWSLAIALAGDSFAEGGVEVEEVDGWQKRTGPIEPRGRG